MSKEWELGKNDWLNEDEKQKKMITPTNSQLLVWNMRCVFVCTRLNCVFFSEFSSLTNMDAGKIYGY